MVEKLRESAMDKEKQMPFIYSDKITVVVQDDGDKVYLYTRFPCPYKEEGEFLVLQFDTPNRKGAQYCEERWPKADICVIYDEGHLLEWPYEDDHADDKRLSRETIQCDCGNPCCFWEK